MADQSTTESSWTETKIRLKKRPKAPQRTNSTQMPKSIKITLPRSESGKLPKIRNKFPSRWIVVPPASIAGLFGGKYAGICYFRTRFSFVSARGKNVDIRPCVLYDIKDGKCYFRTNKPIMISIGKITKLEVDLLHYEWMKLRNWKSRREARAAKRA